MNARLDSDGVAFLNAQGITDAAGLNALNDTQIATIKAAAEIAVDDNGDPISSYRV